MTVTHPFDDLINFLAHLAPEQVLAFKPSEATIQRVQWLLEREKEGLISSEEREELDQYLLQEDLMVIAKARARLQLSRS
ncbi:MAG: hypothetical protein L6Q97_18220 [Thermoanaerobaculia bacterium]|nr:hypothetical protein [Thermoanaerobaculia bacterium]